MLCVHFLNVGQGDCTIIKHHSGRLTMIDINNSQNYDKESFKEFTEEQAKKRNPFDLDFGIPSRNALADAFSPPPTILTGAPLRNALAEVFSSKPSLLDSAIERLEMERQASKELTDPIEFLRTNYPGERLWRFVLTHPDLDHMRGIKNLHDTIGFDNFWDTNHTKPDPTFRSEDDKIDWEFYQQLRTTNRRFYTRGDSLFAFARDENGQPGGDNIEILSPTPELVRVCNQAGKSNSLSLVLRVSHAGRSVLLPGDVEDDAWNIMATFYGSALQSDFLKASHHGRDTGYNLKAVQLISPTFTFVSVGRKPDTDATSKYRQQCERVVSTRYYGNIGINIYDDGLYQLFVERNYDQS